MTVDICTLVTATMMTMQACYSENMCHPSMDGTKQICTGHQPISCGIAGVAYECRRPDGITYVFTGEAATIEASSPIGIK
jgi:hypothetical protein